VGTSPGLDVGWGVTSRWDWKEPQGTAQTERKAKRHYRKGRLGKVGCFRPGKKRRAESAHENLSSVVWNEGQKKGPLFKYRKKRRVNRSRLRGNCSSYGLSKSTPGGSTPHFHKEADIMSFLQLKIVRKSVLSGCRKMRANRDFVETSL